MGQLPEWWLGISGVFFALGSVAMLSIVVMTVLLYRVILELRDGVRVLGTRVDALTQKVDGIASTVKDVTDDFGVRAKGITRVVDNHANTAFDLVEKFAPIIVGAATIARIIGLARGKRRR